MNYPIEKIGDNKPAIGIGGGSYTKSFHFRTVLVKKGSDFALKPAAFIRSAGDLACKLDQGYVFIEPGDHIVTGSGYLPIDPVNPAITLKAFKVLTIEGDYAIVSEEPITVLDLPFKIITGAHIYHNRDGSYFAGGSS